MLRIPKLIILLDAKTFKVVQKSYFDRRLKKVLENPTLKHDQLRDNNNILFQIMMSYAFRVFRLIMIIFTISYFIGTLWYIFVWQMTDSNSTESEKY
jgi:hypothetical protein